MDKKAQLPLLRSKSLIKKEVGEDWNDFNKFKNNYHKIGFLDVLESFVVCMLVRAWAED